jgi:lactobin A/cerein 7B family class IIb bacteriocin
MTAVANNNVAFQELTMTEVEQVSGGILPVLLLIDVGIWFYVSYKAGQLSK